MTTKQQSTAVLVRRSLGLIAPLWLLTLANPASASIAYGSIDNFDTVNDTGSICHGFEIEIDGVRSRDITYTYDWNHYGTPRITEDLSDPLNPRVFIRYQSAKNPDGSWVAYTAIPTGPINPTDGHQFTDPSVNFGGEHFGVGFYGNPAAVKYSWLKDDGTGNLTFAGAVNISTPTFTYAPAIPILAIPAQVQAAIIPPPPPVLPGLEFGVASWVKEIRTQTHNNRKVELKDLVTDDPNDPNDINWKNGEPDEVEVEWQLMQTEFNKAGGGANGELQGAPEDLPGGDEVITRRYEFFKYVGPIDPETGEALCDKVGPDGIHGSGIKIINGVSVDLSTVVVVGNFVGAQMAGFDAEGKIGLIDHLQDGEMGLPYIERTMVVGGTAPIQTTLTGNLPQGMTFDTVTGILSGTPNEAGIFVFTLHSTDAIGGDVTQTYSLTIIGANQIFIATSASPAAGGTTSGDGLYQLGDNIGVLAVPNPGYVFTGWTENGVPVSPDAFYIFVGDASHDLVANFVANDAPTADAGPDQIVSIAHDGDPNTATASVTLDGSASSDPNGDALDFVWDDGQGNYYYGSNPVLDLAAGSYTFTLSVYDPYGYMGSDTVQITVAPEGNQAPIASNQSVSLNQDSSANITLNGSDPDGDSVSYTITGNPTHGTLSGTAPNLTYTPAAGYVGSDSMSYTVTDAYGASVSATVNLTVKDTVAPVITLLGANPLSVTQGTVFSDPGATAVDAVDGTVAVTATGTVNTSVVGSYTRTYTAQDAAGNTATQTRTVNVVAAPISGSDLVLSGVSLSREGTKVKAEVRILNQGNKTINTITISSATLIGVNASTGVPKTIQQLRARKSDSATFSFRGLSRGQTGQLIVKGTSSQGSFTLTKTVTIP